MKKFNKWFMFQISLFLLTAMIASGLSAEEKASFSQLQVASRNGNTVTLSNIQPVYGEQVENVSKVVGLDSAKREIREKNFIYTNATTIPLKTGNGFGIGFDMGEILEGDVVDLDIKIVMPAPVKGTNEIIGSVSFFSSESNKPSYIIEDFRKEDPETHIPGQWGFQLHQKGKIIFSTFFNVVK
jgi:hypothetical protein